MLTPFRSGWSGLRLAGIAPAIVMFALALRFAAPVMDRTLSARTVSVELASLSRDQLPVAIALVPRELEFGLQFYRNQPMPRYEWGQAPAGEHVVVAREGSRGLIERKVPGRRIVLLGAFPEQKLEFFFVSSAVSAAVSPRVSP
jgi:hypothetical protein